MIAAEMAQRLVDRFCATIRYNINVMDPDGIIIAARDSHRVGTYHETAHALVIEHAEVAKVEIGSTPPPGVQPGVNLVLRHRGEVVGVIGVTGETREVDSVAQAVRTAIETMLDYEWEREQLEHGQDRKKQFIDALLYKDNPDTMLLSGLARACGYDPVLPRLPIVLEVSGVARAYDYRRAIKGNSCHSKQDVSLISSSGNITVFKTVPTNGAAIIREIRDVVAEYCESVDHECRAADLGPPRYATGPVQVQLARYRVALRTALWNLHRSTDRLVFFTDSTHDLLLHSIAPEVWHTTFDFLHERLRASTNYDAAALDQLGRTFMVLREENMSPTNAGLRLKIHRNTVVFRLNRLKELTGLDPMTSWYDRETLYLFFYRVSRQNGSPEHVATGDPYRIVATAQKIPH